jgi:hypothetical protein
MANVRQGVKDRRTVADVKAYNKSTTLIIDPSLVFSSYRSTADNWAYSNTR